MGGFRWCKVLLPACPCWRHQRTQIREKMLEFSSTVLPLQHINTTRKLSLVEDQQQTKRVSYHWPRLLTFIMCCFPGHLPYSYLHHLLTHSTVFIIHQTNCAVISAKRPASDLSSEAISDWYSFTLVVALSRLSSSSQIVKASWRFSSWNFCNSSECLCTTFVTSPAVLASADDSSASRALIFSFNSA